MYSIFVVKSVMVSHLYVCLSVGLDLYVMYLLREELCICYRCICYVSVYVMSMLRKEFCICYMSVEERI